LVELNLALVPVLPFGIERDLGILGSSLVIHYEEPA
jgi:hypothetical protein